MQRVEWNKGGVTFLGHGNAQDLVRLEELLQENVLKGCSSGVLRNRIVAMFTEFPSNPLLKVPPILELASLAQRFGCLLIVDDTIGSFANVDLLALHTPDHSIIRGADILCSSLTKIYSGAGNVMTGSFVLNPFLKDSSLSLSSSRYELLDSILQEMKSVDDLPVPFHEDLTVLHDNARNYLHRCHRVNQTTQFLVQYLLGKQREGVLRAVYYPSVQSSYQDLYDAVKRPNFAFSFFEESCHDSWMDDSCSEYVAGYGCLVSFELAENFSPAAFYDNLIVGKGPSLGTNFTLACPYTLLAHYTELEWAESFGVPRNLLRVSVGLEDIAVLIKKFEVAFAAASTG